jgi:malonyl-CoA/methylmalonyl-CoA synthetase
VLPVFHLHGLGVALYGSLLAGSALVFHERFDAARVLDEAEAAGITLLMSVPTMLHRLVEAAAGRPGNPLAGLRAVVSGSAPLAPALFARFERRFGLAPVERYGMSETMMNTSNPVAGPCKPGRVGPPLPGVEIRLRDPDGGDAGRGPGEVQVRGPNVFAGYWRDPAASAEAFDGDWFRTGDLGRLDEDGYLELVGRSKEIVVSGGYNVSPLAVERALAAELDPRLEVEELAVAGVADAALGERVVAFVVPRPGHGEGEAWQTLQEALRRRAEEALPRYAQPREYRLCEALPRNALGKVERARLGDRQASGD